MRKLFSNLAALTLSTMLAHVGLIVAVCVVAFGISGTAMGVKSLPNTLSVHGGVGLVMQLAMVGFIILATLAMFAPLVRAIDKLESMRERDYATNNNPQNKVVYGPE